MKNSNRYINELSRKEMVTIEGGFSGERLAALALRLLLSQLGNGGLQVPSDTNGGLKRARDRMGDF